jgi:hypothetical protein
VVYAFSANATPSSRLELLEASSHLRLQSGYSSLAGYDAELTMASGAVVVHRLLQVA